MPSVKINREILSIALEALENRRTDLTSKIAVIRQALGGVSGDTGSRKRTLSAAARKRIADAQRKRWRIAKKAAVSQKRANKKS